MKAAWLHISLFLLFASQAVAQSVGNERLRIVYPGESLLLSDTLTIVPESLTGRALSPLDSSLFAVENAQIRLDSSLLRFDSIEIRYRVLPYDLSQRYRHLDTTQAKTLEDGLIGIAYNPYAQEEESLSFQGLNYNGNFTRGISFGNNQDLVLNSSFNLQLAGELGDGIEILAAITDENIPIQPEGNTQQLREFDRIFIQLQKDSSRLIAGDYELQRPNSYFMNYFKKLQGATFSNRATVFGDGRLTSNASVAISRGQFTRNRIEAIEGNQGPYKLRGAEGERFIIVLSGTEKVFLDGELLTRGLEQDYIIDYNRGELTFTNQRLITKDSRIVVEFEYADQNYVRSLYALGTSYEQGRFRLDFNMFNQQDSKNATGELGLTNETKQLLSQAGDVEEAAVVSSIDSLEEFTPFRVAYRLLDTLLSCGTTDTTVQYLVFTTEPEGPLFTASFSFVGQGLGAYVLAEAQTANERVYRWVGYGPDCQPLGDYAPVRPVTPPRQQQMYTLGGAYRLGKSANIRTEIGMSRNDLNRFSALDSEDDLGYSAYTELSNTFRLGSDSSGWSLATQASYEWVQRDFEPLNPYRNPEFLRDWSLADVQGRGEVEEADEHIGKAGITLRKAGKGQLDYELSLFNRDNFYTGWQHRWQLREQLERWQLEVDGSLLAAESSTLRTRFLRPRATIAYEFPLLGGLQVGAYGEQERNERLLSAGDTLQSNSFYYNRYRLFLKSDQGEGRSWGSSYSQRIDYSPSGRQFLTSTLATEANVNGKWSWLGGGNRLQLAGNFTYRQLEIQQPEAVPQEPGETFLGRADLNFTVLKGVMQSATTYEIGSGQEAKVEFTYLRVNPGEGDYIWLDSLYNNDGVIQPNEMEIAPFQDLADYIRVTAVTDEFIRTDDVRLNQSLRLTPKALLFKADGWKRWLGKLSTISNLTINRKTQEAQDVAAWNPFQLDVADTSLVAVSSNIRNVLFFNQADPVYDLQLGMNDNRNKFVQTSGFESRRNSEQYLRGRWNISKAVSTNADFTLGQRSSDSEFFNEKDFQIHFFRIKPSLTLLPSRNFRGTLRYEYQEDEDRMTGSEVASQRHDFQLELRYNRSAKTSVQLRASFVQVNFEGVPNSPVGFAILNGLQSGQNYLWNISLDQQLAQNIQLRLSYEGRKTGDASVVHTGRAQVAANF